ncbi:MAG TPA: DUF6454 family protein [Bryobacteraceae bacterium]|nr:DUF6454 family protein [Bryobacteraceae bacterium]
MRLLLLGLSLAAAFAQTPPVLNSSGASRILELQPTTHHVQGIDTDGVHLWVTSVDTAARKGFLHEFLLENGRELRRVELQEGDRFHAGGIAADRESIWIPVAEYRANSSAVIEKRNRQTLALELEFSVPDHIGCIAVTPEFVIGGNWDSRDFYVWDHQGKLIRKVASQSGNAYQDMKLDSDRIVASGGLPGGSGAIDWLELPSMHLLNRVTAGKTDRGASLTREGMTVFKGEIWLLPEDEHSRLFIFPRPAWKSP